MRKVSAVGFWHPLNESVSSIATQGREKRRKPPCTGESYHDLGSPRGRVVAKLATRRNSALTDGGDVGGSRQERAAAFPGRHRRADPAHGLRPLSVVAPPV